MRIHILDGPALVHRAYHALPARSNAAGQPTNAVIGFARSLRKLFRDLTPTHFGVAFDDTNEEGCVRNDLYPDYKANRPTPPDDLVAQFETVRRLLDVYRIPVFSVPRFEADDVIATLAAKAVERGHQLEILSADKDLFQLVGGDVRMWHLTRARLYDARLVEEDFGVSPGQVRDVLALMGDSSDNVPGVPGIGAKGACRLIVERGSLDALLKRITAVAKKSHRNSLREHREDAVLSQQLVTLYDDLPIALDLDALQVTEPEPADVARLFRELDIAPHETLSYAWPNHRQHVEVHIPQSDRSDRWMDVRYCRYPTDGYPRGFYVRTAGDGYQRLSNVRGWRSARTAA